MLRHLVPGWASRGTDARADTVTDNSGTSTHSSAGTDAYFGTSTSSRPHATEFTGTDSPGPCGERRGATWRSQSRTEQDRWCAWQSRDPAWHVLLLVSVDGAVLHRG